MPTPRMLGLAISSSRGDGEPMVPASPREVAAVERGASGGGAVMDADGPVAEPTAAAAPAAAAGPPTVRGELAHCDSLEISAEGTLHLQGAQTVHEYNINAAGMKRQVATGSTPRGRVLGGAGGAPQGSADNGGGADDEEAVHFRCPAESLVPIGETIGTGVSSHVRVSVHLDTHRLVAVKVISVFDRERRAMVLNEIRALCEAPASAPGLVDFFGAFYTPESGQLSLVLEYMDGGSLRDLAEKAPGKRLPESVLRHAARAMAQGLLHLHTRQKLVHRDIKPDNVLIGLDGSIKITDFGISAGVGTESGTAAEMCASFRGTVTYMSPERINSEPYSFPCDIWGVGLALYELATGAYPYNAGSEGPFQLMLQVMHDPAPALPAVDARSGVSFSDEFRDFVAGCLIKDPKARPTAAQLLAHPFLSQVDAAGPGALEVERAETATFVSSVINPAQRLQHTAEMFAEFFYAVFDDDSLRQRELIRLYSNESRLSVEGEVAVGAHAATAMLRDYRTALAVSSGNRPIKHRLLHVDAQQLAGAHADEFAAAGACLLVHVQGEVLALHAGAHGEERSIGGFAEVFVVGSAAAFAAGAHGAAWGGGSMLVHSQVRRQL